MEIRISKLLLFWIITYLDTGRLAPLKYDQVYPGSKFPGSENRVSKMAGPIPGLSEVRGLWKSEW